MYNISHMESIYQPICQAWNYPHQSPLGRGKERGCDVSIPGLGHVGVAPGPRAKPRAKPRANNRAKGCSVWEKTVNIFEMVGKWTMNILQCNTIYIYILIYICII